MGTEAGRTLRAPKLQTPPSPHLSLSIRFPRSPAFSCRWSQPDSEAISERINSCLVLHRPCARLNCPLQGQGPRKNCHFTATQGPEFSRERGCHPPTPQTLSSGRRVTWGWDRSLASLGRASRTFTRRHKCPSAPAVQLGQRLSLLCCCHHGSLFKDR